MENTISFEVSGLLPLEAYTILEGYDAALIRSHIKETWRIDQPDEYKCHHRFPNRILRMPVNTMREGESIYAVGHPEIRISGYGNTDFPVRAASWRIQWKGACRGTSACVGIGIRSLPIGLHWIVCWDAPKETIKLEDRLKSTVYRSGGVKLPHSDDEVLLTVVVNEFSRGNCRISLTYLFPSFKHCLTIKAIVPVSRDVDDVEIYPCAATTWGFSEIQLEFLGFLRSSVPSLRVINRWKQMQSYLNSINPHARPSLDENYVYETLKQIVNQSRLAPIDKKLLLQFSKHYRPTRDPI